LGEPQRLHGNKGNDLLKEVGTSERRYIASEVLGKNREPCNLLGDLCPEGRKEGKLRIY